MARRSLEWDTIFEILDAYCVLRGEWPIGSALGNVGNGGTETVPYNRLPIAVVHVTSVGLALRDMQPQLRKRLRTYLRARWVRWATSMAIDRYPDGECPEDLRLRQRRAKEKVYSMERSKVFCEMMDDITDQLRRRRVFGSPM